MGAIGVIALNAFRESLRDKILYHLVLFAGLLIGFSVFLADLSITEHHKIIADVGLAATGSRRAGDSRRALARDAAALSLPCRARP